MLLPLDYLQHRHACKAKQSQRTAKIASLPTAYTGSCSEYEKKILNLPVETLVQRVHSRTINPIDILKSYTKIALRAHAETNCLTEILTPEAQNWAEGNDSDLIGPLAGIPISLKDSIGIKGYDSCIGYSAHTGKPYRQDGTLVQILKAAGAIPYVKTNVPITLLSFESSNDVWGRTTNPHNANYSPGGSTGGEAALLAYGGGRIGIGSDVAGSVRVPAHFSGIYALRCSTGRWPKGGVTTSTLGQEGVPSVFSPMARTLEDLEYFSRSIIGMKCWKWDYSVHPIDWREELYSQSSQKETLRIGVMRTDHVVDPSPACSRALDLAIAALRADGHYCEDVEPPSPYLALQIASRLLISDGGQTFRDPFRSGESIDAGVSQLSFYARLPRFCKYLHYLWIYYVRRDPIWAGLLHGWHAQSSFQQWQWVAQRESYKASWHQWWKDGEYDFILSPVNATPAVTHNGMHDAVSSCGYSFLFNLIDYTAGVIPVTKVDRSLDGIPKKFDFKALNGIAQGAYKQYNAEKMHGLPVGIQVIGRRLQEEQVLAFMSRVQKSLARHGTVYHNLDID